MMASIESITQLLAFIILLTSVKFSTTEQFDVDEQISDVPNDGSVQKYLEEQSKGWIEQGDQRQPKVNVKQELGKMNISHVWDSSWPTKTRQLGSVSAVSFDNIGNVVVFHRGDHVWDGSSFNYGNIYLQRNKGPILANAIIAFNRKTGEISYEWGSGLFYMPHGLTVDHENNVWVTDVALHQVMKFNANNRTKPELTLGTAFQPGNSFKKFCKPTAVAVLPNGDFFVSDGYCNARIIKYSRTGERILSWGQNSFSGFAFDHAPRNFFAVPHALALVPDLGLLCVADRENGRVQCFHTDNGTFHSQYHSGIVGDRLFSVAYAPINGGQLYVVNGPLFDKSANNAVLGFVIHMRSNKVIAKFGPNDGVFENPHDIIVTPDGNEIYVAQYAPNIAFKFISKTQSTSNKIEAIPNRSELKPQRILDNNTMIMEMEKAAADVQQTSRQLLFIIGLFVAFICITLFALWLIRRRKLDSRNRRRHAWDFPTVKTDFKLGNLLERNKGFEKLKQEASDEEPNSSTNALLSSAQFA